MKSLDATFFNGNRTRTIERLQGSLLVASAYSQMQRGNDMAFQFEQEANFWYLTGIEHADWWVIIDGKRNKTWLVSPVIDDVHDLFNGSLSASSAKQISGIDEVIDRSEALALLRQAARTYQTVYTIDQPAHSEHFGFTMNPAARELRDQLSRLFKRVEDFRPKIAELRAIKQPVEIDAMQSAIDLTIEAFTHVKQSIKTYKYEYQVEADFSHIFRRAGARGHAYDPIVADENNACTLHYIHNDDPLKKGSLLLLDIGARRHGYAADITRTYAIGKPTKRQIAVHDAVVRAQSEIIALLQPNLNVAEYHDLVDEIMKQALMDLGLITDADDPRYRTYFPHAVSHGLGIDVHDSLGKPRTFQEGMVLTVEPGIYIPEENIGVRIEDDILITRNGHRNLSAKLSTSMD
ncbi:M24 family metallopeptidase [bacterium]|nr:MAG: M24 family metallopeptidase [bacterium]